MAGSQISTSVTIIDNLKGFIALNVNSLDGGSSPTILAGSVVEVAGAFFSFSLDTAPTVVSALATGSAAIVYLEPSGTAGSQILTPTYRRTGPVWVPSKNGWYLSAGSNIRAALGFYYDGTDYLDKQVLTNENTTGEINKFRGSGYGVQGSSIYGFGGYFSTKKGINALYVQGGSLFGGTTVRTAIYGSGGAIGVSYGVRGSGNNVGVYGDGAVEGFDFYAGGAGTNYGPFTGGHEVITEKDEYKQGQIVVCTGETKKRDGSISSTLPTVKLCDKENDSSIFGVFNSTIILTEDHWYTPKEGEKFATCNALGEGRVLVTDVNGELELGDYITTSKIKGYGQKQEDDILHSYTLGKVTEKVNWEDIPKGKSGHKEYLIACVYVSA